MRRTSRPAAGLLVATLTTALLPALPAVAADPADTGTAVFTSEVHYDNVGGDTGEAFEITAPTTDTDLGGWTLVLYNGNGGGTYGDAVDLGMLELVADGDVARATVDFPTNGIQNGSPDGWALVDAVGEVVEFLSYEGVIEAAGGPALGMTSSDIGVAESSSTPVGQSLQRDAATDPWTGPAPSTFVRPGDGGGDAPVVVKIHEVQGSGDATPLDATTVTVEGVVTGLQRSRDVVVGFHLQEQDGDVDADPATSEALFVFCGSACPAGLAAGDRAVVTGTAGEFADTTQVVATSTDGVTVTATGQPLPTPTPLSLPAPAGTDTETVFEATESMLVEFTTTLAVSEYFALARFGSLVLTADERPQQFTQTDAPSVEGYAAFLDDLATRRIILDDDNNDQNDAILPEGQPEEAYPYPSGGAVDGLDVDNRFRGGDTITGLTGVIDWDFGEWRVRPVDTVEYVFDRDNPRTGAPVEVGGDLTVASFNVLNYFTTLDDGTSVCGPTGGLDCRGANSAQELERQTAKIVAALAAIDADVVGLIEIQNDDGAATEALVEALNAEVGADTYAAVDTGTLGTDAIKQALIHKPASVTPVGAFEVFDGADDPRFDDDKNRPSLLQEFADANGATFTVAVNHLKSKGSSCTGLEDETIQDGQGNCSETRRLAAEALVEYLADPTNPGVAERTLLIGDLNAYAQDDAIRTIEAGGYTDLVRAFEGPDAYGYVFDGQLGTLDYALASASLVHEVTGATSWHVNADEAPLFDYDDDVVDAGEASFDKESSVGTLYAPDAYRSSDHDPVVVGLSLTPPNRAPVADAGGPYEVKKNETLTIDATASNDPDGDELTHAWDLDGDGAFDDATGPVVRFEAEGKAGDTVVVAVRVTDAAGLSDTDAATITLTRKDPEKQAEKDEKEREKDAAKAARQRDEADRRDRR